MQSLHTLRNVIGRDKGMPIHANDDLSLGLTDSGIERSRHNSGGVGEDGGRGTGDRRRRTGDRRRGMVDRRRRIQDITDDLSGGVSGHAVCDEELHAINWVILRQDRSQARLN
jgi:hypothetical protein